MQQQQTLTADAGEQVEIRPETEEIGVATSFQDYRPVGVDIGTGTEINLEELDKMFQKMEVTQKALDDRLNVQMEDISCQYSEQIIQMPDEGEQADI